jgi:serine/threonine protein kinase
VTEGFRWCPHCQRPHSLEARRCASTGLALDGALHHSRGGAPPREQSPLVGLILDRKYRMLRLIGRGGMGQVFEAENIQQQRMVAVKVVAEGTRPEALVRLEREAQVVAAIKHPNICDVHDVGRMPNGGPYVVFERLFGETLAARARGRQLPINYAIEIFSQILAGLSAAHAASIVHRDMKPENVFLVDRAGAAPLVKVVDFGFSQDLSMVAARRITRPGRACGTVQYMSPEQLRCERVDHRSDLFGVGIMLYEVLAGRHPFAATSLVDLQVNILRAAPLPLRVQRPAASRELEQVVSWALARSPSERPSSATELNAALHSLGRSAMVSLGDDEPVSVTEPVWFPPPSSPSP